MIVETEMAMPVYAGAQDVEVAVQTISFIISNETSNIRPGNGNGPLCTHLRVAPSRDTCETPNM